MLLSPLLASILLLVAGDDLPSGSQPGEKLKDFKVLAFSGPKEGKEFEVIADTKNRPTLLIFVNGITRPALRLLRPIDDYAAKNDRLAAHIIWLGDKEKSEEYLKRAKNSFNLQTPIGISLDGKDGPGAYGLNSMVILTIILAKDQKVVANFAFADPNDSAAPKVLAAIRKLLK